MATANDNCLCDPSFPDRFADNECLRNACTAYHAVTCFWFGVVTLYVLRVLVFALATAKQKKQVKTMVLFALTWFCLLRCLRAGILSGYEDRESPPHGMNVFLRLLYVLPPVLAFIAWSLLAFVWIRMYNFVRDPMSLRNGVFKLNRWLVAYIAVISVLVAGWCIIIIEYAVRATQGVINYYSAGVLLLLNISFVLSGWRFAKTLKESASVNPSKLKMFKQVQKFVLLTTGEFWLLFFVFVIFPFITDIVPTAEWFIARHYIYRTVEGATVVTMTLTYTPPWRELLFGKSPEVFNGFSSEASTTHRHTQLSASSMGTSSQALVGTSSQEFLTSSSSPQGSPMDAGVELP